MCVKAVSPPLTAVCLGLYDPPQYCVLRCTLYNVLCTARRGPAHGKTGILYSRAQLTLSFKITNNRVQRSCENGEVGCQILLTRNETYVIFCATARTRGLCVTHAVRTTWCYSCTALSRSQQQHMRCTERDVQNAMTDVPNAMYRTRCTVCGIRVFERRSRARYSASATCSATACAASPRYAVGVHDRLAIGGWRLMAD